VADAPSHDVPRLLARWKDGGAAALQELLRVMSHAGFPTMAWRLCLAVLIRAQDLPGPQATFRTGIDVIQIDVSVLDRDRRPVHGLAAADFTVRRRHPTIRDLRAARTTPQRRLRFRVR
jgi:hypothetical protein